MNRLHSRRSRYRRDQLNGLREQVKAERSRADRWMEQTLLIDRAFRELVKKSYPIYPIEKWER